LGAARINGSFKRSGVEAARRLEGRPGSNRRYVRALNNLRAAAAHRKYERIARQVAKRKRTGAADVQERVRVETTEFGLMRFKPTAASGARVSSTA